MEITSPFASCLLRLVSEFFFLWGITQMAARYLFYRSMKGSIHSFNKQLRTNSVEAPALLVLCLVREAWQETGCQCSGEGGGIRGTCERRVHLSQRAAGCSGTSWWRGPQDGESSKEARGLGWGGRRIKEEEGRGAQGPIQELGLLSQVTRRPLEGLSRQGQFPHLKHQLGCCVENRV